MEDESEFLLTTVLQSPSNDLREYLGIPDFSHFPFNLHNVNCYYSIRIHMMEIQFS